MRKQRVALAFSFPKNSENYKEKLNLGRIQRLRGSFNGQDGLGQVQTIAATAVITLKNDVFNTLAKKSA